MLSFILKFLRKEKSLRDCIDEDFYAILELINEPEEIQNFVKIKSTIRKFRMKWSDEDTISVVYALYNSIIVKAFNYTLLIFIRRSSNGNVEKGEEKRESSDS